MLSWKYLEGKRESVVERSRVLDVRPVRDGKEAERGASGAARMLEERRRSSTGSFMVSRAYYFDGSGGGHARRWGW